MCHIDLTQAVFYKPDRKRAARRLQIKSIHIKVFGLTEHYYLLHTWHYFFISAYSERIINDIVSKLIPSFSISGEEVDNKRKWERVPGTFDPNNYNYQCSRAALCGTEIPQNKYKIFPVVPSTTNNIVVSEKLRLRKRNRFVFFNLLRVN